MLNVDSLLNCAEANAWTQLRNGFNDRKLPANAYGHGNNDGSVTIDAQFPVELTPAQLLQDPSAELPEVKKNEVHA